MPRLTKPGAQLRAWVNAHYPGRDKRSDGWIADAEAYEAAKAAEEAEAAAKAERRREVLIAIAGASGLTIQEVEEALA